MMAASEVEANRNNLPGQSISLPGGVVGDGTLHTSDSWVEAQGPRPFGDGEPQFQSFVSRMNGR